MAKLTVYQGRSGSELYSVVKFRGPEQRRMGPRYSAGSCRDRYQGSELKGLAGEVGGVLSVDRGRVFRVEQLD